MKFPRELRSVETHRTAKLSINSRSNSFKRAAHRHDSDDWQLPTFGCKLPSARNALLMHRFHVFLQQKHRIRRYRVFAIYAFCAHGCIR
jgi:hypothetical protein